MDGEDSDMAIDDVQLLNCGSGEFFLLVLHLWYTLVVHTCGTLQIGFRLVINSDTALLNIILKCLTTMKSIQTLQLILE